MSEPTRQLPARPSLEHLRKQAKDLLRTLRATDPAATLAHAQLTLAREYGFDSWPKLVHHVEAVYPQGLEQYEQIADAIADAYTTANFTAIREINWMHATSFAWDRDPERMRQRLPTWYASTARRVEDARTDARHLVARGLGFDDWNALRHSLAPTRTGVPAAAASYYRIDADRDAIEVRGPLAPQHWDAVIAAIREHGVTTVHVGGITDDALERIASCDGITALEMESGVLTDDGMQHLARMPQLEKLVCGGPSSPLTDRGLAVLRHLTALRRFQMTWSARVTDDGLAHLRHCDRIEAVSVMGTRTGDGVIRALAGKPELRRLQTGAAVTDTGIPHLHDIPRFARWQGGDLDYGLMSFDVGPTFLLLDGPFTHAGMAALAGLDGLFGLSFFWHVPNLTSAALAALPGMANLGFVGCQDALCDDVAMQHIARIPKLRMLMGQGAVAGDDGWTALGTSPTLEYIWGRENPNLRARGFAALTGLPSLKGLAVGLHNAGDDGLALLPQLTALRHLATMGLNDDQFRFVGACTSLEQLTCMYCRTTGDIATAHIANLQLRSYYAGATQMTDASCALLGDMQSLEKVELWDTQHVTDAGIAHLARLPHLREIGFGGLPHVTRAAVSMFGAGVRVSG